LYSLICIALVVGLFAFAMNNFVTENIFRTRRLLDSQACTFLLRSAIACAAGQIQEKIGDRNSDIFQVLTRESLPANQVLSVDLSPLDTLATEFRNGAAGVTVTLVKADPLSTEHLTETTGGNDAVERVCELRFEAWSKCGNVNQTQTQYRILKVTNLAPGILGKFSFFLKYPESEDAFNVYANNINGWKDDRATDDESSLPIVFKNGGDLDNPLDTSEASWKKRGYIYLGGSLTLNLTSGCDDEYGENFHFSRLGAGTVIPSYYPPVQPNSFSNPPNFTTNRYPTQNTGSGFAADFALGLKVLANGYFTADADDNNMNVKKRLDVFFPASTKDVHPSMRSSILHLFGNGSTPSPTLVLGNVNRRYALYSGIVLEYTGNDNRDAFLTYLPNKRASNFSGLVTLASVISPQSDGDLPAGTEIKVDTMYVNLENMFDTLDEYYKSASTIVSEPYLRSHDFLYHQDSSSFHPQTSSFGTTQAACQSSFELTFAESLSRSAPFFKNGSLSELPEDFLESKTVYTVTTVQELADHFQDSTTKTWSFGAAILIIGKEDETAELPAGFTYDRGGILVFENGNVKVPLLKRGADPDQILTICALNGNIQLDLSTTGTMEANLIALRGKLVNLTPSRALDLQGGVGVFQFPADSFPAGGQVSYNPQCDPSGEEYSLFYRAHISDIPFSIEGS